MLSHVMVGTNNIERSKRFYDAVLAVLGAGEPFRNQNSTGQVRLFYRHDGSSFASANLSTANRQLSPTEPRLGSSALPQSKCSSSMKLQLHMAAHQLSSLRACARARWAPCTSLTCATPTATNSAPSIGPNEWVQAARLVNQSKTHWPMSGEASG